ncbi:hypothetical protein [Caproiciproducens galactitolivorans]|uniref:Yip1 domain protein n=1 Tax=Caproiciproducens galactitolivorans TaxID=642589 RepID=A0ABT4BP71_9FIRM|nr:hypothetical protein [Caproiciproducens galactitolivorans]MCY1712685.1 hypothetical protein [Caproiciproducens galactitolivorans]
MAKFCVYCGRPLQEGEVCTCKNQAARQMTPPSTPAPDTTPSAAQSAPVTPGAAQVYIKHIWELIKKSFQAPSSMLRSFAASGDSKTAFGLIGIRALAFALFMLVLCTRITSSIMAIVGKIYSGIQDYIQFPLAKVFFLSLLISFGVACLFAALLLLFNKYVGRAETTYNNMLCVAAGSGIAVIPFLLAGILLMFLNLNLGFCIAFFGSVLGLIFALAALPGASQIDSNKSVYVLFAASVVLLIAVYILIKLFFPVFLPDGLVNGVKDLGSGSPFSSINPSLFK